MSPEEFWALVDRRGEDECWPWLGGQNGNGRGRVKFDGRSQYAYRIAWELTHGEPIPADLLACHHCDNPICVNPGHIFIGTARDNAQDASRKGRLWTPPRIGVEHHAVTVTPEMVARAVAEYLNGDETQAQVAERYGVSQTALSDWMRGVVRPDAGLTPTRKPFKPCGTRAAYERHRRNGETPCEPCRLAELANQRERRARRAGVAQEAAA